MAEETATGTQAAAAQRPGERLRAARLKKKVDLAKLAEETRIPQRHLITIEADDFAKLPSRTYALGFSRTYAKKVGEDADEIVALVREELAETGAASGFNARETFEPGDPARIPSRSLAWVTGLAAILLLVGGFVFFQTFFSPGSGPSPLQDPNAQVAEAEADADEAAPQQAAANLQGAVTFTSEMDGTWVKFYDANGERLFEAQMNEGDSYTIPANANGPQVWTGHPYALAITVGGQEVPKLSLIDEVIKDMPVSAAALAARGAVPASGPSGAGAGADAANAQPDPV